MINCFYGISDQQKAFSLISSKNHCQRSSPLEISNKLEAGFEPVQNLGLGLVEWSCAVVITTTPQHHNTQLFKYLQRIPLVKEDCYLREAFNEKLAKRWLTEMRYLLDSYSISYFILSIIKLLNIIRLNKSEKI